MKGRRGARGQGVDLHALFLGPRIDLVIDVGDVSNVGHPIHAVNVAQQTVEYVENDDGPAIADVDEVIDRGATDIHAKVFRV